MEKITIIGGGNGGFAAAADLTIRTTDKYKIQLYVLYQTDWRADASGVDQKTGIGHMSPGAIGARGGHTVAHEVGHTFQYLVSADLGQSHGYNYGYGAGASGGNGWWESCANWQAYKVYPERQFTGAGRRTT